MSFSRAVSSAIRCRACRTAIEPSAPPALLNCATLRTSWIAPATFPRSISSTAKRRAYKHDPKNEDPEFSFLDEENDTEPSAQATEARSTPTTAAPPEPSPLPWYLQNRPTPTPQQAAIIPDLPPNPPPLLPTLLDYIANTAGLDDLKLLDLRHLDPPPALGPALLMVLATARSEKHLHVSADRFCRYLRRTHHLRANAAGLLGRNELKIKLRRKAKRMKMLANVGGAVEEQGNLDDGIRTGWICCTVGKIEAHPEDRSMEVGMGGGQFVGFREMKPGVNVVVQMFTEEKRGEIDLETLWGGVLRTHERRDKNAEEALKELEEDVEEDAHEIKVEAREVTERAPEPEARAPMPSHQFRKPRPASSDVFPPASNPNAFQQIRRLHSVELRV